MITEARGALLTMTFAKTGFSVQLSPPLYGGSVAYPPGTSAAFNMTVNRTPASRRRVSTMGRMVAI